ncbi:4-hydroxyphenylpyruvate dioxygenase, partial [Saccharothrix sp. MB29]|nr:4-hydroxyphenylpyruvate dioxygenase [Saccharothrix sp. MB29]
MGDARQAAFYLCTAFGFKICGQGGSETGLDGVRSLLLRQGDIQVVLTTGLVPDHPAAEYVRKHGDG